MYGFFEKETNFFCFFREFIVVFPNLPYFCLSNDAPNQE